MNMNIDIYKTKTIEDTELIYTILREKYPNKQIEIEFNDNTKDYTLRLTEAEFKYDPEVPLNVTIKVCYGDSITGDSPVLLQKDGLVYIKTVQDLFDIKNKIEYPGFKLFDQSIRLEKEYCLSDFKVWCDKGWTNIKKIIRHKTNKKIYRVLTHTGCIDVSEDHSLLNSKLDKVKPEELNIGDILSHSFPTIFDENFINNYLKQNKVDGYDYFLKSGVLISIATSKIEAAIYYYIFSSICKVQIEYNSNEIYKLSNIVCYKYNEIKKIIEIPSITINDYIYDIETECGRLICGVGQLQISNTDSIFISIKFNRNDLIENRKDAFKLAIQCGNNITEMFNRHPIELEFEKVYQPFVLLTKKRYIGKKYEDTRDPMKLKTLTTSGIAITKRNYCNMVKKCYREVIDCVMDTSDLDEAIEIYKRYIDRIDNYQINQEDLVVSAQIGKEYSCKTCKKKTEWIIKCDKCKTINTKMTPMCSGFYKNGVCNKKFECLHTFSLGHINLAQKFLYRNEDICIGDRIQYIYVESESSGASKSELTEDPNYAKINNIKFNRGCYLEQLAKSVMGFFKVVLQNEQDLIDELLQFTNEKLVEFGSIKLKISDFKITED